MHGDDYMLNSKLHYAIITCAITYNHAATMPPRRRAKRPSAGDRHLPKGARAERPQTNKANWGHNM